MKIITKEQAIKRFTDNKYPDHIFINYGDYESMQDMLKYINNKLRYKERYISYFENGKYSDNPGSLTIFEILVEKYNEINK